MNHSLGTATLNIWVNILLILLMTLSGSLASINLSIGVKSQFKKYWNLILGLSLYLISAILNIYLLRYNPLSLIMPMTTLTYAWTLILSKYWLKDQVTKYTIWGNLIIMGGIILIATG